MAERELLAAKAEVARSQADLKTTIAMLRERLKPANLAGDAWTTVKKKSSAASDHGVKAVTAHPGAAGGALLATALFLMRGPLAGLLTRIFGGDRHTDRVKANLLDTNQDYDLTAPVVAAEKGI